MNKIFDLNSPVMQKLAQFPDLILLNVLWLIFSIPVVTIGASTTALHAVAQTYVAGEDHGIIKPFFRSFCKNFKQSTILWIPVMAFCVMLIIDLVYLLGAETGKQMLLWIPVLLLGAILLVVVSYSFPLIARYENDTKTIISNSFLLFSLHFFPSLAIMVLNALPWLLLALFPNVFVKTSILWIPVGGSLVAYINNHILLPIFKKYDPKPDEENKIG